ncbi:FACT complex subunit SSRP1-like isoform X2 [Cephus cinctus]|uniref:FACT complex subunit SSRP1-like isoform X2 n=1 Tax=Cephus cinctus TaxID=211228 RepID=A0AAJ7RW27_CEPCN|nr:FACT complex subunit SSRP1-like isoform X2 [Cephus cinctus]
MNEHMDKMEEPCNETNLRNEDSQQLDLLQQNLEPVLGFCFPCSTKKSEPQSSKSKCKSGKSDKSGKRHKTPISRNPFLIFFLTMYYKDPSKSVTEVAKAAGKIWCRMSEKEKEKYIKKAREERKRRQNKSKKIC